MRRCSPHGNIPLAMRRTLGRAPDLAVAKSDREAIGAFPLGAVRRWRSSYGSKRSLCGVEHLPRLRAAVGGTGELRGNPGKRMGPNHHGFRLDPSKSAGRELTRAICRQLKRAIKSASDQSCPMITRVHGARVACKKARAGAQTHSRCETEPLCARKHGASRCGAFAVAAP